MGFGVVVCDICFFCSETLSDGRMYIFAFSPFLILVSLNSISALVAKCDKENIIEKINKINFKK